MFGLMVSGYSSSCREGRAAHCSMVVRAACSYLSGPGRREANAGPPQASPFLSSTSPPPSLPGPHNGLWCSPLSGSSFQGKFSLEDPHRYTQRPRMVIDLGSLPGSYGYQHHGDDSCQVCVLEAVVPCCLTPDPLTPDPWRF